MISKEQSSTAIKQLGAFDSIESRNNGNNVYHYAAVESDLLALVKLYILEMYIYGLGAACRKMCQHMYVHI